MTAEDIIQRYKNLRVTSAERSYQESTTEYIQLIFDCKGIYPILAKESEDTKKITAINLWAAMYVLGLMPGGIIEPLYNGKPSTQELLTLAKELAK